MTQNLWLASIMLAANTALWSECGRFEVVVEFH